MAIATRAEVAMKLILMVLIVAAEKIASDSRSSGSLKMDILILPLELPPNEKYMPKPEQFILKL